MPSAALSRSRGSIRGKAREHLQGQLTPADTVLLIGRIVLLAEFVWLVVFSLHEYRIDSLTQDFSTYAQALWLIAHGHLNPLDTSVGVHVWQNDGELILWPLALLSYLPGGMVWLKIAQDAVLIATGWVALSWVSEITRESEWKDKFPRALAIALAGVLLVCNPALVGAAGFDVHVEPFGGFFAILAARAAWRGRTRPAVLWAIAICLCGTSCVLLAVAVAVVALVYRNGPGGAKLPRSIALGIGGGALVWMLVLGATHADHSLVVANFSYLVGTRTSPTAVQILFAAVHHPSAVAHQVRINAMNMFRDVSFSGGIGVLNPWGLLLAVVVLVPAILSQGSFFASLGFQVFPLFAFVVVGTVLAVRRVATSRALRRGVVIALVAVLGLTVAEAGIPELVSGPTGWLVVSDSTAHQLSRVKEEIPASATVVVSQGVSGWFAERQSLYVVMSLPPSPKHEQLSSMLLRSVCARVPGNDRPLYLVLTPRQGIETMPIEVTQALVHSVVHSGASVLSHRSGVWFLRWHPRGSCLARVG